MRSLWLVALALGLNGCASFGISDSSLRLKVEPDPAMRGKPALFVVNAPMDADEVTGVLEIFTSPSFKFKKNPKKKYWYIYNKIPKTDLVPPGTYSVRVFYLYKDHPPHFLRMKLVLK